MALVRISLVVSLALLSSPAYSDPRKIANPPPGLPVTDAPEDFIGNTVTAVLISMDASLVTQYNGTDRDKIIVDIVGQGPIPWSISRYNRGDLAPRIQPRHPFSQTNLGVPGNAIGGFETNDTRNFAAQAWKPTLSEGVILATVAQNGQQWNDGTPKFYGTVACTTRSLGYGYSMDVGLFSNDDPNIGVTIGKVGAMGEGNIDVAVAWFPYDQGWTAGYLDRADDTVKSPPKWQIFKAHSPNLPDDASQVLTWGSKGASLKLPGVNPTTDGMLFATSTDPGEENDNVNTVGLYTQHHHEAWRVQQREDSATNASNLASIGEGMFGFVFIPWTAAGLVGGNIEGATGQTLSGRGSYIVKRLTTGTYEICVGHQNAAAPKLTKKKEGMLLLQVIGHDDSGRHLTKQAFLSYNYTSVGTMIVESRHLVTYSSGKEEYPLIDSDFSFAWVDFRVPLAPNPLTYLGQSVVKSGSSGFWSGFFSAVVMVAVAALVGYGTVLYVRSRTHGPLFWKFEQDAAPMTELGTDLLRSDFRFGE